MKKKQKKRKPGRRPGGKTAKLSNEQMLAAAKLIFTDRKKQKEVAKRYNLSQSYFHAQLRDAIKNKVVRIDVAKGAAFKKKAA